jgi:hypothetical protein
MDKFWTNLATFSESVNRSMWSWFPNNLETLIVQQIIIGVTFLLFWDILPSGSFIAATVNFTAFLPINLYLILKGKSAP